MSTTEIAPRVLPATLPPRSVTADPAGEPADAGTQVALPGLSLRSNFAWILGGNVAYALCQWAAVVALAKLGNSYMVGQFALGLAIATPVLMFTNLHLRAVQATDARRQYTFGEYLRLRSVLTLAALLAIAAIAFFGGYERQTAAVILAVALAKGIESLSDIHYGLFQLNDRLDQSGKSMMIRGVIAVIAMSAGLYLGRSVLWGCLGLAVGWLGTLCLFDMKRARLFARIRSGRPATIRHSWKLVRTALPLGIATTMAAVNLNMPRYFIHARLGERQLGIYSAIAYTTIAMILVSDSMGHCAIPRLARAYSADRLHEFRSLLLKLIAAGATLGIAGLAIVQVFGGRLLSLVYGGEYAAQYRVFRLLILATAIYCVACMFTSAITAARNFRIQAPLYILIVGANALACAHWVPIAGLAGGAAGMLAAATVHFVIGGGVLAGLLWRPRS